MKTSASAQKKKKKERVTLNSASPSGCKVNHDSDAAPQVRSSETCADRCKREKEEREGGVGRKRERERESTAQLK